MSTRNLRSEKKEKLQPMKELLESEKKMIDRT